MIKAVTFDFWNTLYREDDSTLSRRTDRRAELVGAFFRSAGRQFEAQRIRQAIQSVSDYADSLHLQEQRNLSHGEFGQLIAQRLGLEISHDDGVVMGELMSSAGRECPPIPVDWVGNLLARLDGKVKLGIISDTSLTFGMHLEQVMASHGLAKHFDHCTWSDLTLTCKPMARQFLYTLAMLEVQPDEAVHVGDLEIRDVQGAKGVGMRTIRLLREGDGRASQADATVPNLAGIPAVLARWGLEL